MGASVPVGGVTIVTRGARFADTLLAFVACGKDAARLGSRFVREFVGPLASASDGRRTGWAPLRATARGDGSFAFGVADGVESLELLLPRSLGMRSRPSFGRGRALPARPDAGLASPLLSALSLSTFSIRGGWGDAGIHSGCRPTLPGIGQTGDDDSAKDISSAN
jgi:hypothetical protein